MVRAALALFLLLATPAAAQPRITDADARAFVARQEQLWNAGDRAGYFAAFTPDARFTDQAYVGEGKPPVPYGTSTLAEARAQSRKAAGSKPHESGRVTRVAIAADGRSARVEASIFSTVKTRRLCAARVQTLVLAAGRLRSTGQTDTYIRCRGG
jgi:hypothetical protein